MDNNHIAKFFTIMCFGGTLTVIQIKAFVWLWNNYLVGLIDGIHEINWKQVIGLIMLGKIVKRAI